MALAEFPPAGIELAGRSSVSDCRESVGDGPRAAPSGSLTLGAKRSIRLVRFVRQLSG